MASHFAVLNRGDGSGKNGMARTGNLELNPVHQAMYEACDMVKPAFILNTVLGAEKRIMACFAGDWKKAFAEGSAFYADHFSCRLQQKSDLVIVSCGGFPKDINLIQSHKSMEYASQALKDGGIMILLAECRDGYGHPTFFDWFRFKDPAAFEARLRSHYEINGQTAYSLLCKAQRFRIILVSGLPPDEVSNMQMTPAATLDAAINIARELMPDNFSYYVMPEGGTVLPVVI
jgi:nickel-dependent lactate racemase